MRIGRAVLWLTLACGREPAPNPPATVEIPPEAPPREVAPVEPPPAPREVSPELRALLEQAAGVGVEVGEPGQLIERGARPVEGHAPEFNYLYGGPGSRAQAERAPRPVRVAVRLLPIEPLSSEGTFDIDRVAREFRRRLPAFQRCVEQLPEPPSEGLVARIDLRIGVHMQAVSADPVGELAGQECLVAIARRTRWTPGPSGGEVAYRVAVEVTRVGSNPPGEVDTRG